MFVYRWSIYNTSSVFNSFVHVLSFHCLVDTEQNLAFVWNMIAIIFEILKIFLFYFYLCVYMYMWHTWTRTHGVQKMSDPLKQELEFEVVVSYLTWVLGTKHRSSAKAFLSLLLITEPSLQVLKFSFCFAIFVFIFLIQNHVYSSEWLWT